MHQQLAALLLPALFGLLVLLAPAASAHGGAAVAEGFGQNPTWPHYLDFAFRET